MILADTSAWVEYDRRSGTSVHRALAELMGNELDAVAATEPVLMEVLAGARTDADADRLRLMLMSLTWLPCDPVADFEAAARIYRQCRAGGITPRSLADCLIATIALRTDAELLAADRHFEQMARIIPLRLYPV